MNTHPFLNPIKEGKMKIHCLIHTLKETNIVDWYDDPDPVYGDQDAVYYIIEYTENPPPFPRNKIRSGPFQGYALASRELESYDKQADVMLCLADELEEDK